ncbi:hypothetical protein [Caproicibacterium amylolyticum]|uniref:Uncharacterized protein n=1 Tax=Caproicibacterium amylolyticum TaxID=2766537 RepID=A0A7G9WGV1_9FIRM|nr:hypothetical protein [Caproicibacterium amylolyticum]QNO17913.1 hypothetical protein H6X83_13540 [Caproicibacterium amylolyticum]
MKIEYAHSAIGLEPDMIISASDFLKAFDDETEYNFLRFSVDAFTAGHGFENQFAMQHYRAAKGWLKRSSSVLFVVKERDISPIRYIRWCEIYVITDGKMMNAITSEDGAHLDVNIKRDNATSNERGDVS